MDLQNDVRILVTVLGFILFVAICLWAYSKNSKQHFDNAAQQPFLDDDLPSSGKQSSSANGE
ncbi:MULTISPECIES: CcoQ/FixQ family Cbb3-type cytochrome c oxidase assembly chaperone [Chitinibacter]|jgi:cytochrome c oxidase cbb3-type subunit 4|uniref:CcoQ/FixQ family Cbb3-type cytochrome c oxidase assembly chaperone n=1 Tax=Chitinibacter TaxID=230666 RepID=UPI0003F82A0D|nr:MULTISPECIES: CcoQ/FixQ family Cbb3-type cytochrome c oxidase assembly chaperone [Chitinibacter]